MIKRLNLGTQDNPHVITENEKEVEYVLESGVYVLRNSVIIKEMWGTSQVKEMWGSSQVKEMWGSSQVNVMRESSQVNVMRESSQVNVMRESSQVNVMWGSSQVNVMRESSQVKEMWGSSQVKEMWGSSQVKEMWGSSQVKEMWGSSQVNVMWGSSQVNVMWGTGIISNFRGKFIDAKGYNTILTSQEFLPNVKLNSTSQIIILPERNSIDFYLKSYPSIILPNGNLLMYKAVHKQHMFIADYDRAFTYEVGKEYSHEIDINTTNSCAKGLHCSYLQWAVIFGRSWHDLAILELEVNPNDCVVSSDTDGKLRTSKLKVLREVPKEEYEQYL